eukprot:SAG22_NODE_10369_length_539_cov_0.822727_2_plen_95_part_01
MLRPAGRAAEAEGRLTAALAPLVSPEAELRRFVSGWCTKGWAKIAKEARQTPEQLRQLRPSELRKLALACRVPQEKLEEAEDSDAPKEALVQLVL